MCQLLPHMATYFNFLFKINLLCVAQAEVWLLSLCVFGTYCLVCVCDKVHG